MHSADIGFGDQDCSGSSGGVMVAHPWNPTGATTQVPPELIDKHVTLKD